MCSNFELAPREMVRLLWLISEVVSQRTKRRYTMQDAKKHMTKNSLTVIRSIAFFHFPFILTLPGSISKVQELATKMPYIAFVPETLVKALLIEFLLHLSALAYPFQNYRRASLIPYP